MNDIRRIGGWSAVLFGVAMVVSFVLLLTIFVVMPAEAMEPGNQTALLAAMGSLGSARRAVLTLGLGLEIVAGVLMFPAFLAVHGVTKDRSDGRSALALGMATLGTTFFILQVVFGFSVVVLSAAFLRGGDAAQAARVTTYGYTQGLSLTWQSLFFLFLAWSAVLWFGLMRNTLFARWIRWIGLLAGLLGVISTVGSAFVAALGPVSGAVGLLLIAWFLGVGVSLLRAGGGVR